LGKAEKKLKTVERKVIREKKMKTIAEEEEIREENSRVREWTEKDDDEIDNIIDPYYEL